MQVLHVFVTAAIARHNKQIRLVRDCQVTVSEACHRKGDAIAVIGLLWRCRKGASCRRFGAGVLKQVEDPVKADAGPVEG